MPPTIGEVRTGEAVLHYSVSGRGRPILLLSGGPGFSGDYLLPVAHELSKVCRSILPDQRGTGKSRQSEPDTSTINLQTAVDDIETLRKHLKIEELIIFGHSWGGVLAMSYTAAYPARAEALMLVGSGGPNDYPDRSVGARIRARLLPSDLDALAYWTESAHTAANPEQAANEHFRAALPAYVFDRRSAPKIIETMGQMAFNPKVYQLMAQDLDRIKYDLRPALKDYKQPVLIVQGREDVVGESTARRINQTLSNSRLEFIEECGHFPWVEQPRQFFAIVERFLKELPAAK